MIRSIIYMGLVLCTVLFLRSCYDAHKDFSVETIKQALPDYK